MVTWGSGLGVLDGGLGMLEGGLGVLEGEFGLEKVRKKLNLGKLSKPFYFKLLQVLTISEVLLACQGLIEVLLGENLKKNRFSLKVIGSP